MHEISPSSATPLERFIAPARRAPQIWRLLVGLVLMLAVYLLPVLAVGLALRAALPVEVARGLISQMVSGSTPFGLLVALASFVGMAAGPMLAARLLHRRRGRSLFGPRGTILRNFLRVVAVLGLLQGVILLGIFAFNDLQPNLDPRLWLMLLPLALPAILLQVSAEEMVFRGYLMQQLAARFRSPLIWLFLPALFFGIGHFVPQEAAGNAWAVAAWATLFGIFASDLTIRTGNLGAAIGFHLVNNVFSLLVVSLQGPMSGLSLYTLPFDGADSERLPQLMWGELLVLVLAWLLCRLVLKRGGANAPGAATAAPGTDTPA